MILTVKKNIGKLLLVIVIIVLFLCNFNTLKSLFITNLSGLYLLTGNNQKALELADETLNSYFKTSATYYNAYTQKGDLNLLIEAYKLAPNNFTYLSKLAEDSIEQGKWYESQKYFNSLKLARHLSNKGLEFAYDNDDNISKKGLFYLCFARKISNDPIVSSNLGRALSYKYYCYNKGKILFDEAEKNDPKNPTYYSDLGYLAYRKMDYTLARSFYAISYRLDQNNYWNTISIADTFNIEKNYIEALEWLDKSKKMDPEIETAYYNSARIFDEIGKIDLAELEYKKIVEIKPMNYSPRYNWGVFLYTKGEYKKSITQLSMSIIFKEDFIWSYYYRSLVYEQIGNIEKALQDIQKGLLFDNTNKAFQDRFDDLKSKIDKTPD
jgi:tetratricopeptide (TPR) repeat protein